MTACLDTAATDCGGGIVCPATKQCLPNGGCAAPEQVAACDGLAGGAACMFGPTSSVQVGECVDGACIGSLCGNGVIDPGEVCDPGAPATGGGECRSDCLQLARCGDGVVEPFADEECDDGPANANAPNHCRTDCKKPSCGDGIIDDQAGEECDGSAASATTCLDFGFYNAPGLTCGSLCEFDTSACTGFCGDRVVNGDEACDGQSPQGQSCLDFGFESGVLGCGLSCQPDLSGCHKPGWVAQVSGTTVDLDGAWASGPADVFAVGSGGTIVHFDGRAYAPLDSGTTVALRGVFGFAPDEVYAVGDAGTILEWNGTSWVAQASRTTADLFAVWGSGPSDVWAVGANETVVHFDGNAWGVENVGTTGISYLSVWGSGPDDVWIAGTAQTSPPAQPLHFDGTFLEPVAAPQCPFVSGASTAAVYFACGTQVLESTDEQTFATTFSVPDFPPEFEFAFTMEPTDVGYIVGTNGTVIAFDGTTWTLSTTKTTNQTLLGVFAVGPDVYAVGTTGTILHNTFSAFATTPTSTTSPLFDVEPAGPTTVIASGRGANVEVFNGTTWASFLPPPAFLRPIAETDMPAVFRASETSDVFTIADVVTPQNKIIPELAQLRVSDFTWLDDGPTPGAATALGGPGPNPILGPLPLRHIWGDTSTDLFGVGDGGAIQQSTDGGGIWTPMTSPTTANLLGVSGSGPDDVFAVGAGGTIAHYDGVAWSLQASGTTADLRAVYAKVRSDAFAVGKAGEVLHWDGLAWAPIASPVGVDLSGVAGIGVTDIVAVGDGGTAISLQRSCVCRRRSPATTARTTTATA